MSKFLETIAKEDLDAYMKAQNTLPSSQHSFRKGRSSTTALATASVRPKQEFQPLAETEYSAAKNHRIFGTLTYFRPKVNDLLRTNNKIGQIRTTSLKFDVCLNHPDLIIIT
jgi:hypothetical protein